jgi:hypothetical protein
MCRVQGEGVRMRRLLRVRGASRWALAGAILAPLTLAAMPGMAQAQAPTPALPTVLDGPSANIVGLSGMSLARDGTGGVAYLKDVGGTQHVFVSRLTGRFRAPEQLDAGLPGPSSQPVIAAGNGGLLLAAFINGGELYVVDRLSAGAGYSAPIPLAAGASNPAIAITNLGKAYLAFTVAGAGGHDVRCAYYNQGNWALEAAPLDAVPADDAGTGAGRPAVAAAGDGVGIVAWGEAGHVFTRRVWATAPSVVFEQADPASLSGWNEVSSSDPVLATGGDSSYVAVAFREVVSSGGQQQSRVLVRRLRASAYEGVAQADGLSTPGAEGADRPEIEVGEYGQGFVTSERATSHQLIATQLGNNDSPGAVSQLDSLPNSSEPLAAPTWAGYHSALIAWQENPSVGSPQIRARFFDGTSFGPEQVLSSPGTGPTDAADGLDAAGDIAADAAVAWVQGGAGSRSIVVAQLYQPPGSFQALKAFRYTRTTKPTLSWTPAREFWGPVRYLVAAGGTRVGQTTGTALRIPSVLPLGQGGHSWQVTAVNPAGLTKSDRAATVFVDTIAPKVGARLSGRRTVGSRLLIRVRSTDAVGIPRAEASGIKEILVKWGDGTSNRIQKRQSHTYSAARRYKISVIVTDRAGNRTTVVLKIRITRPSRRAKGKHAHR